MTRAVVSKVAWAGARSSYTGAEEDLRRLAGLEVSRAEFSRVVLEEGRRVGERQSEREDRFAGPLAGTAPPEIAPEQLVIEADATIVLTVAGEEHKAVYCGRAFDARARGRKEQEASPGGGGAQEQGRGRAFVADSRYVVSAGTLEEFEGRLVGLARRCGERGAGKIAFLADGAVGLWNLAERRWPGAVMIQDFWHVSEHLYELAGELWGEDTEAAREAGRQWSGLVRESRVGDVLEELRLLRKKLRGGARAAVEKELGYLESGRGRMDYKRYEAEGWPIGSGAIEGACKHVVKERMCVTGARWRRANIPNVVALRECRANGEWDEDFGWAATRARQTA